MQVLSAAEAEAAAKGMYHQLRHPEGIDLNVEEGHFHGQSISEQQLLPTHADVTDAASAIALQNAAAAALAKRQSHRKLQ